jgi:hypothetical protein
LDSWAITKSGCSSGIQCPENGTITPLTFSAKACVEFNVVLPGKSPPNQKILLSACMIK